ncbi:permease [Cellulomonas sp. APG4]|uniref:permease n=1 Tax=Cellulomonas sp. APG4 TaxID=1538656 RepID=UPI00351BB818
MTATPGLRSRSTRLVGALALLAAAWVALLVANEHVWRALALAVGAEGALAGAVEFFVYDSVKILLLLVGLVFAIGMLRTTLRPERVRAFLEGRPLALSLVLAALLGAVTPFCSCSSIPLFIGFVAAGVPIGVTLAFLIASPLVNEVAVVMLADLFGWQLTAAYVGAGLTLAVLAGWGLSRLSLERWVEPFVLEAPVARLTADGHRPSLSERVEAARAETREIVGRVWRWVLVGIAVGAVIHGWVPTDVVAAYAGPDDPFAVVVATLAGVPLYSNAAGVIPIAEALWAKGMATGTVMAFMMATVALSIPEAVLLRRVLRPPLLGLFFGAVTVGILAVGLTFNAVF